MKSFHVFLRVFLFLFLILFESNDGRLIPGSRRDEIRKEREREKARERESTTTTTKKRDTTPTQPGQNGINHLVTNQLPGAPEYNHRHWAGYISVTTSSKQTANLFYWMFESTSQTAETDPLVIWMNGGPFCSSFDGALLEKLSPFVISPDYNCPGLVANPNPWSAHANILFLDQPVGTGLSYGAILNSRADLNGAMTEAAHSFHQFLIQLIQYYPWFANRPLYLFGESFAGQYIPFYADYLLNKTKPSDGINLVGVGVGNGWIDGLYQYTTYTDFAVGNGLMIPGQKRWIDKKSNAACTADINNRRAGIHARDEPCLSLEDDSLYVTGPSGNNVVFYDIRLYGSSSRYPSPQQQCLETYLQREDVLDALHATSFPDTFEECSLRAYGLDNRIYGTTIPQLVSLLNQGIRVLLYSGQFDYICNHIGTTSILDSLTPENITWINSFHKATPVIWQTGGESLPSGYVQTFANLTYILFLGGGHMCPMDRPAPGQDMFARFINSLPWRNAVAQKKVDALLFDEAPMCPIIPSPTPIPPTPSPLPAASSASPVDTFTSTPTATPQNLPPTPKGCVCPTLTFTPKATASPTPRKGDDDASDSDSSSVDDILEYHKVSLFVVGALSFVIGAAAMGFVLGLIYKLDQRRMAYAQMEGGSASASTPPSLRF